MEIALTTIEAEIVVAALADHEVAVKGAGLLKGQEKDSHLAAVDALRARLETSLYGCP